MITFREFIERVELLDDILEANRHFPNSPATFSSREEGEKHHKGTPPGYYWNNRGSKENPKWRLKPNSQKKGEEERRRTNLKPLSHDELKDHAKRNLYPTPQKTANKALKIERERKRQQKDDARSRTQQTGQQHDVDHISAQPNRRSETTRARFQSIHPGDASDNRRVMLGKANRSKNSSNTEKSTTRAGAIRAAAMRALE